MAPSRLEDEEFRQVFAAAYVAGATIVELMETFKIGSRNTVHVYLRDERMKALIAKETTERVTRMTRKLDAELENRISGPHLKHLPLDELLKIRKEIVGPAAQRIQVDKNVTVEKNETISLDLWGALDGNPEAMERLGRMLSPGPQNDTDVVEGEVVEDEAEPVAALGADTEEGP